MTAADQALAVGRTAREVAEAVAREKREEADRILASVEARQRRYAEQVQEAARHLVEDGPLAEWFPETMWAYADHPNAEGTYFHEYVVTPADASRGTFHLMLNRSDNHHERYHPRTGEDEDRTKPVRVWWAVERHDEGYRSWMVGPKVTGLEQLGELLLRQQEARRGHGA